MPNEFAEQEEAAPSDITQSVVKEGSPATNPPHWLTKGMWGIGLASFLADVGHEVPTAGSVRTEITEKLLGRMEGSPSHSLTYEAACITVCRAAIRWRKACRCSRRETTSPMVRRGRR